MPHRDDRGHAKQRIRQVRRSNRLSRFDYIDRGTDGAYEQIYCKLCGVLIKGYVVHGDWEETKEINGQIVKFQRLVMAETPIYEEMEMDFDGDISLHVTPMCTKCSNKPLSQSQLEDLFVADLSVMGDDEDHGFGDVRWDVQARRKPKKRRRRLRQRARRQ